MLDRLYLLALALVMPQCPLRRAGGGGWERKVWMSMLRLLLLRPRKTAENWMDG